MNTRPALLLAASLLALTAAAPATADRGGKPGHERDREQRNERHDERGRHDTHDGGLSIDLHFGDGQRQIIRSYYGDVLRRGHCPPGLAKKGNGCLPPGQAKQWRRGYALPRSVTYYTLPRDLVVRLPLPPAGHQYVRVAADILLIAVGSRMVVDAIEDLGNF